VLIPKNGNRIALDTNTTIAILNQLQGPSQWIQGFKEVFLPVTVVGELRFGALKSQRSMANLLRIEDFASRCQILEVRLETADVYARLRMGLRTIGRPIPENDLWIAAICVEHGLPLATSDGHFDDVKELSVEPPPT
jgi:tRNA(fMet)-specific endonuclease VapC